MQAQKTAVSLNEGIRRAEKLADDAWRLQLENELRIATNKPQAKDLDELEDLIEAESSESTAAAALESAAPETAVEPTEQLETIAVVEDDPLLQEAGNIVADLVRLQVQNHGRSDFADGAYPDLPTGVAKVPAGT